MLHSISPQYCQERAIQARSLANRTTEPEAREAILAVAEQYEHLAERGELLRDRLGTRHAIDRSGSETKGSVMRRQPAQWARV